MTWQQIELFEKWLPVGRYEGFYEVSNFGRIRSLGRFVQNRNQYASISWRKAGRILKLVRDKAGYERVIFYDAQHRGKRYLVHRIVAAAFLGSCPLGKEVDHIDGNRANNIVQNLRYVTKSQNSKASVSRRGVWVRPKLTDDQIVELRHLAIEGMTRNTIAEHFGITPRYVREILAGKYRVKPMKGA